MNYFETNEKQDFKMLLTFNNAAHIFSEVGATPQYHHCDATAQTVTKFGEVRKFNIELKRRNLTLGPDGTVMGEHFTADTIFIESHKACDLLMDNLMGYEPLYVNFLNDGIVMIFNLNKLTKRPKKEKKIIKSKGYNTMEVAARQGLYIKDAAIYKNNKLIKRCGEEWKIKKGS